MGLYELLQHVKTQQQRVWEKGTIVPGYDPDHWRKDVAGAWIYRWAYGLQSHAFGWEMDHIIPSAQGGSDYAFNLRPLQAENNRRRQDGPLRSFVSAIGNQNARLIPYEQPSYLKAALGLYP